MKHEGKTEVAKALKANNISLDIIRISTGLTADEIKAL
jgi:hypothetical protein